jgi:hypothetical protein
VHQYFVLFWCNGRERFLIYFGVCIFLCSDYVFEGVMIMNEKSVEENALEKTKGNACM